MVTVLGSSCVEEVEGVTGLLKGPILSGPRALRTVPVCSPGVRDLVLCPSSGWFSTGAASGALSSLAGVRDLVLCSSSGRFRPSPSRAGVRERPRTKGRTRMSSGNTWSSGTRVKLLQEAVEGPCRGHRLRGLSDGSFPVGSVA